MLKNWIVDRSTARDFTVSNISYEFTLKYSFHVIGIVDLVTYFTELCKYLSWNFPFWSNFCEKQIRRLHCSAKTVKITSLIFKQLLTLTNLNFFKWDTKFWTPFHWYWRISWILNFRKYLLTLLHISWTTTT